ncbi:hypothetical protein GCM10011354_27590 [Egicoccus halophilus]|uniref:Uncharacterized protein n=2 Tax=Egicoccus halophilus TaxID=1670830 RepID=A0A8J3AGU6_9ACTN|nr:hypothetical protein GCM10011354_27590 [Egicoccus halophilus]
MPARASYRDLLRDLLGRSVTVRGAGAQELRPERPSYLAGYRFDDGKAAAVAVADLDLAAAMAASIAMLPPMETRTQVQEAGELDEELLEFLHEVVNVAAKLMNSPTTPHVVFRELVPVPGEVAEDLVSIAREPSRRQDWHVTVDGYGEGLLTLLG